LSAFPQRIAGNIFAMERAIILGVLCPGTLVHFEGISISLIPTDWCEW
jgi:hypothetical protein